MTTLSDSRAVFIDRDGTVVELLYDRENGYIDSAVKADQLRLIPGAVDALKRLRSAGYKLILVSNQPGVAKGRISLDEFQATRQRFDQLLNREGILFDDEYYCLHHPNALLAEYRKACECRKPKPGLILKAAKEHNLNLNLCYMVGDDLLDIRAGKAAGCNTILISHVTDLLLKVLESEGLRPDGIASNLSEASDLILHDVAKASASERLHASNNIEEYGKK
jgi:D-glycero-D-manno-heptose 1,7-bisphosphate phosphatase